MSNFSSDQERFTVTDRSDIVLSRKTCAIVIMAIVVMVFVIGHLTGIVYPIV